VVSLDFQSTGYAFSLTIIDGDFSAEGLRWNMVRHEVHWAVCQHQVCDIYSEDRHCVIMWTPVNNIYYAFSFCQAVHSVADFANLRACSDCTCPEGTCQRRAYWEPRSVPGSFHTIDKLSNKTSKVFSPFLHLGFNAVNKKVRWWLWIYLYFGFPLTRRNRSIIKDCE
jgi:hypothetical protein